jgi:predicted transcriptional regulator of viral defense system
VPVTSLSDWTDSLAAKGRHSFSLKEVRSSFPDDSESAIKLKLNRLSKKGKIISIHKGYYLIITAQYATRGILPPALFIDGLMLFLEKPYYVGLLNAAAFYGAAHQQPQEYFVFTDFPVLRSTKKKNIKINYISRREMPLDLLEKRKTETGYLNISSPELTAADLIQYEKRIGGLNRAVTVLNELAETIKADSLNSRFLEKTATATIQRLGYLLDKVLNNHVLADRIFQECMQLQLPFFRIPLKTSGSKKGYPTDEKWKIIVNTTIEIDE